MKLEHLCEAIKDTGRVYSGIDDNICDALRGIMARAGRYEANDPETDIEVYEIFIGKIVKEELGKLLK